MKSPITIRKATLDDLDFIERCAKSLYEIEKKFEPYMHYIQGQYHNRDMASIHNPDALVLIAETHTPSAYLYAYLETLNSEAKQCVVEVIYIIPEFRGQSLARQLLQVCMRWATEKKASRIIANIYADNQASLKAFEKEGFHSHHVTMLLELN